MFPTFDSSPKEQTRVKYTASIDDDTVDLRHPFLVNWQYNIFDDVDNSINDKMISELIVQDSFLTLLSPFSYKTDYNGQIFVPFVFLQIH